MRRCLLLYALLRIFCVTRNMSRCSRPWYWRRLTRHTWYDATGFDRRRIRFSACIVQQVSNCVGKPFVCVDDRTCPCRRRLFVALCVLMILPLRYCCGIGTGMQHKIDEHSNNAGTTAVLLYFARVVLANARYQVCLATLAPKLKDRSYYSRS